MGEWITRPPPNQKKNAKCGLYMLEYETFLKYSTV